ncbi:WD40-repeat-containing domain protein [Cytidiella melzeri]|nr:WD40-repeat-containing domain protein [Cytidiella melzeri]
MGESSISSDGSSLYTPMFEGGRARINSRKVKQPTVGPEIYIEFEGRVIELDRQLHKLCNKARILGSSAGILSASTHLYDRLGRVLDLFRQNAMNLYPKEIKAHVKADTTSIKTTWRKKYVQLASKTQVQSPAKPDSLVLEFQMFSKEVVILFDCFTQFPEFAELPDCSLADDLRVWANSLDDFEHEFSTLAVQKYLYDSMADIGERLESLAKHFIPTFTEIGIPTARASQDHITSKTENLTVVAALFAGIATGMLQIVSGSGRLGSAIALLWYMSLIFSVSSAVNGLLGLSRMQAIYRSPDHHVPWWVLMWIKQFPIIFLVLSVVCFFIALILMAFTPQQSRATLIVTTFLSSSSCFGLIVVSGWSICEFLVYSHYEGRMWLAEVLNRKKEIVAKVMPDRWQFAWRGRLELVFYRTNKEDIELNDRPVNIGFRPSSRRLDSEDSFWLAYDSIAMSESQKARHRWHEAVRRIIEQQRQERGRSAPRLSPRFAHLTKSAIGTLGYNAVSKLKSMTISTLYQINEKHGALVRSLQFSPNGKYLVTSSWDSQLFLFRINTPVLCERILTFPVNTGYVHQVDWSPDGDKLLTRHTRRLIVWHLDVDWNDGTIREAGVIAEYQPGANDDAIRSARWNGEGSGTSMLLCLPFFSNTSNQTVREYSRQHLDFSAVCVTSDSRWMICVGKYLQDKPGEKYGIVVWDLVNDKVAKIVPVYYEMSDVTIASDHRSILISYQNKAPSQLWLLMVHMGGTDIALRHSYMPKETTSFAALPSIFGGEHDHLVLRAGTVGDIYVWDRDSAALVYCLRAPPILKGQLTSFAWNRGSDSYMFATGTHDGTVYVWAPEADVMSDDKKEDF